jgi:hypothetical protein
VKQFLAISLSRKAAAFVLNLDEHAFGAGTREKN